MPPRLHPWFEGLRVFGLNRGSPPRHRCLGDPFQVTAGVRAGVVTGARNYCNQRCSEDCEKPGLGVRQIPLCLLPAVSLLMLLPSLCLPFLPCEMGGC